MRMGIPRVIMTDQGSEFCNKLNEEFNRVLGIKHQLTTAYHPQVTFKFHPEHVYVGKWVG